KPTAHIDIAGARANHISFRDRRLRHRITNDVDHFLLTCGEVLDLKAGQRTARSTEKVSDLRKRLTKNVDAIYLDDLIAVSKTGPVSGSVFKRRLDKSGGNIALFIAQIAYGCADAIVARALIGLKLLKFLGVEVVGVWVERVKHRVDRIL